MAATTLTSIPPLEALEAEHLRLLIRVSHEFNSTLDLAALLPRILEPVMEALQADAGALWLVEEGGALCCRHAEGAVAPDLVGIELPAGAGMAGDVVVRRSPALVTEASSDERHLPQLDELTGFPTGSLICVPLITGDEVLGAIEVMTRQGGAGVFGERDRIFLEALSDDAAAAIRNAKLVEAERQARDLAALLEVSHELTSSFDVDRVMLSVVNLAGKAVEFERCVLALWEGDELKARAISGETKVDRRAAAVRELERFMAWGARREEQVYVRDLSVEDDEVAAEVRAKFPRWVEESGAQGFVIRRVADAEGDLGVILFELRHTRPLTDWERKSIQLLEDEAALALRNAQLYADVPFISWLEPLAEKKRALAALPAATWLRYGAMALAVVVALTVIRVPLRIGAAESTVRAAVQMPVRAGVGGILDAVLVEEGQRVEAGATLALLRDDELTRRYREAEAGAELAMREALAAEARGDAAAAAMARIRAAEMTDAAALLSRQLDLARVVAPATGIVLTPRMDEKVGQFARAGEPVAWIGDPDWVELELWVPQEELGRIAVEDRVRAKVAAHPSVIFAGRVAAVAPSAEIRDGRPTYAVRAIVDNRSGLLRPGMSASAKVLTERRPLAEFLFRRPWRWLRMRLWW